MASGSEPQALPTLTSLLALGTSTNQADLRESEAQLTSYEAHFHSHPNPEVRPWAAYARIALPGHGSPLSLPQSHQHAEVAIRTLAIIRLKHAIDKYWRGARMVSRARAADNTNGLTPVRILDDDKANLRRILLEHVLVEQNKAIALQVSVCISRIARTDFPQFWPDLFDRSLAALHEAASQVIGNSSAASAADLERHTLTMLRAAEVAKRSIKELSSIKIVSGKVRMAEVSFTTAVGTLHDHASDGVYCSLLAGETDLAHSRVILPSTIHFDLSYKHVS